jgi:hypothetical protein
MNTSKKMIVAAATLVIGLSACAGTPTAPSPASTSPASVAPSSAPSATAAQTAIDAADNPFPGYSQRTARNGETLYCREDEVAGTRIPKLVCGTEAVLRNQSDEAKKQVGDMRQTAGQGGCNPAEGC